MAAVPSTTAFIGEARTGLAKMAAKAGTATSSFVQSQAAPSTPSGAPAPLATAEQPAAARGTGLLSRIPKVVLIGGVAVLAWLGYRKFIK